jgi:hypothetical protein
LIRRQRRTKCECAVALGSLLIVPIYGFLAWVFSEAATFHSGHDADDRVPLIGRIERAAHALTERVAVGPKPRREVLVDDRDAFRLCRVEVAPAHDRNTERREVAFADRSLECVWRRRSVGRSVTVDDIGRLGVGAAEREI